MFISVLLIICSYNAAKMNVFKGPFSELMCQVANTGLLYSGKRSRQEERIPEPVGGLHTLYREQERRKHVLGWRCTRKDPFEGECEQITSWLIANPEWSSGDIFQKLQCRSPGRYHPLHIRTLQRGMRKIRAHLLETFEEQWQEEVIGGPSPSPISPTERSTRNS